jgi:hypothetical protein
MPQPGNHRASRAMVPDFQTELPSPGLNLKVNGQWVYLYRAVDPANRTHRRKAKHRSGTLGRRSGGLRPGKPVTQ